MVSSISSVAKTIKKMQEKSGVDEKLKEIRVNGNKQTNKPACTGVQGYSHVPGPPS